MSRVELDTFINDRYAAIEDRLQVRSRPFNAHAGCLLITNGVCSHYMIDLQVVRKRLNRPLTYAEKVVFRPAATLGLMLSPEQSLQCIFSCRDDQCTQEHRSSCDLGPCCEQVVYGHLDDPENEDIRRGISYLRLRPGILHTKRHADLCI